MNATIYGLTPAQADCARVIGALTSFEGKSPSYAEIAAELCVSHSKSGVHRLVHGLIERGWIVPRDLKRAARDWLAVYPRFVLSIPNQRRGLRLTRSPPPFDYSAIAITEAGREYLEQAA